MKTHRAGQRGWTDWVQPTMKRYAMACCDCGLVHTLQFRVVKVRANKGAGYKSVAPVSGNSHIVHFRAKRNESATKKLRSAE